ncbi:MAG TPA: Ig-like domain-containing protein, partial [Thermoanaerobaculia bacterium]|nr:Ig-like domain-containing protein [Thermoanaerobaculia bacterium]
ASILVTFSEPVAFASLSGPALQLTDLTSGAGVTTTFQHLEGERPVLLTPASGLQTDRQYRLTVQSVTDNGGNVMTAPVTTTFWTVDTIPPQIVAVDFPEGTSFVSGDDVPVVVTATDERGVDLVEVTITEWTWSDAAQPYDFAGLAPVVSEATAIPVEVTVTDVFGNTSTAAPSIQVSPRANVTSPTVALECVRELGFVVPGVAAEIRLLTSDDEAVESLRLYVDGEEIERVTPVNLPDTEQGFLWTPPDSVPQGTAFVVRLESRDFAGNVTSREVSLQVPTGTILRGGGSLFDDHSGQGLTLAEGVYTAREPLHLASLRIARGATLVTVGQPEAAGVLEVVADQVDLACGAEVDVTGLGYPGATAPSWVAAAGGDAGGSHGGSGRSGVPGEAYGSVYEPSLAGAGGAATSGGPGGGVVLVEAGELFLDGTVLARGVGNVAGANEASAGAGGAVYLNAGSLSGSGTVDASGGDQNRCSIAFGEGSGGGGRIAIHAGALVGFDPDVQTTARGGTQFQCDSPAGYAGAGTVLTKLGGVLHGRLRVDNGTAEDGSVREGPA